MTFYKQYKTISEDPSVEVVEMYNSITAEIINQFPYEEYEIKLYLEYYSQCKGRLLELACGSGRLTLELARRGIKVLAMDNSQFMLDQMKDNMMKDQERDVLLANLEMCNQDIFEYNFKDNFNMAVLPATSISLLAFDEERLLTAINRLYEGLNKDGLFIFDYLIVTDDAPKNFTFEIELKGKGYRNMATNFVVRRKKSLVFNMFSEELDTGKKFLTYSNKKIITPNFVYDLIDKTQFTILDEVDYGMEDGYCHRFVILKK